MDVGLIRVLTLDNRNEIDRHGKILEKAFPALKVESRCIEDQHNGIYDTQSEERAKPKIIKLAKQMRKGIEALIISCAADPAVEELKEELDIPVVGAGESVAAVSRTLGNHVGVITITDDIPLTIRDILGKRCFTSVKVEGVHNTLDLKANYDNILTAARTLLERGSDVIALACTGFSTLGIAAKLAQELRIPVVDPVLAAGSIIHNLAMMKRGW